MLMLEKIPNSSGDIEKLYLTIKSRNVSLLKSSMAWRLKESFSTLFCEGHGTCTVGKFHLGRKMQISK